MRNIVTLSSGCIVVLSGLFYGFHLKNPAASDSPAPEPPPLKKAVKPIVSVPSEPPANNSSTVAFSDDVVPRQDNPEIGTGQASIKTIRPETARMQDAGHSQWSSGKKTSPKANPMEEPSNLETGEFDQLEAPIGIRLAPDVRLPVAAMPLDFKVSPVAKKALEQIVADYYQEIALAPALNDHKESSSPDRADLIEESENGELTRIINKSPAVDEARKRADARFKALFGYQAYNRMTINTLLEARTPVLKNE